MNLHRRLSLGLINIPNKRNKNMEEYRQSAIQSSSMAFTLPETNIAPENGWLEYYFPIGARFIFRCENVSFREGIW